MNRLAKTFAVASLALCVVSSVAAAQPFGPGGGWMGPGTMMGPGMMGRGFGALCNPGSAGFAQWRIDRIENVVRPNDTQRAALNDLRAASTKARDSLVTSCPKDEPNTSVERLSFMEKRMEAMLAAIRIVRPAFEAFYSTLDSDQKSRLDAMGPGRRGWGWRWRNGW